MQFNTFAVRVTDALDGATSVAKPQGTSGPLAGLFPGSELLIYGNADAVVQGPLGLIDPILWTSNRTAHWLTLFNVTGPNRAGVDTANSRIEVVRTPGGPEDVYTPGIPFAGGDGSKFNTAIIQNGYVLRLELRDAGSVLVPGPWDLFFTLAPIQTAEDLCCLCDLTEAQCVPPEDLVLQAAGGGPPPPLTGGGAPQNYEIVGTNVGPNTALLEPLPGFLTIITQGPAVGNVYPFTLQAIGGAPNASVTLSLTNDGTSTCAGTAAPDLTVLAA